MSPRKDAAAMTPDEVAELIDRAEELKKAITDHWAEFNSAGERNGWDPFNTRYAEAQANEKLWRTVL